MQNANFSRLGLSDANGTLVERYEYTPYGQRTVYKKAGIDDELTTAPLYHSQRVETDAGLAPYGLCDVGHQGLMHDEQFGLVYNRFRYLDPRTGRWGQRDPVQYISGPNLYLYCQSSPISWLDIYGLHEKCVDLPELTRNTIVPADEMRIGEGPHPSATGPSRGSLALDYPGTNVREPGILGLGPSDRTSPWTSSDLVLHYWTGGGAPIDLAEVGLLGVFKNAPSVKQAGRKGVRNLCLTQRGFSLAFCPGLDRLMPCPGHPGPRPAESSRTC